MSDAKFEDGSERPLQLLVVDEKDLEVASALLQDAVFTKADLKWDKRKREFIFLFNRFRWEVRAETGAPERVRTLMRVRDVVRVRMRNFTPQNEAGEGGQAGQAGADEESHALLHIRAEKTEKAEKGREGAHNTAIILEFSGQGACRIDVECINIVLCDVTLPYRAVSGKRPEHAIEEASADAQPERE